jgi:hypothetical protein
MHTRVDDVDGHPHATDDGDGKHVTPTTTRLSSRSVRDSIKQQKEDWATALAERMTRLNQQLRDEQDHRRTASMARRQTKCAAWRARTRECMDEAAAHVKVLHAEHAMWQKQRQDVPKDMSRHMLDR